MKGGFVKEWIQLVKRREPTAKVLVVTTHGGPQQRQPDIDRQELWDLFGKDTVLDFFFVESKPDAQSGRRGAQELSAGQPRFARDRQALSAAGASAGCLPRPRDGRRNSVALHQHLAPPRPSLHYEHDPALRDIVVLKPDWLTTAISFVLDDEETCKTQGLVRLSRLSQLWNDPGRREAEFRYLAELPSASRTGSARNSA
ncbi:MAG: COR domain-containing protein [Candidatus Electronema sp. VV]